MGGARRESAEGKLLVDEPDDGIVRLTISNPAKRNALDHAILDGIAEELPRFDDARCLILTGANGMFSAGYDIGDIPEDVFAERAEKLVAHPFVAALDALEGFPAPTIAALPGPTIGGGLELAIVCDFRIAAAGIQMGMPPARLGLVYGHTGLRRFIDTIGLVHTRELFLLARGIRAETAEQWGLVNSVAPPEQLERRTLDMARQIASFAPLAQRGNKEMLRELLRARGRLDPELEARLVALREACFRSEDLREGILAFAEKRSAQWKGR